MTLAKLRDLALRYPGTEAAPSRGRCAVKVRKRVFLVLAADDEGLDVEVKLPGSAALALALPFVEPANAGRAVCGWVLAHFAAGEDVPLGLLEEWIDESYRAVAPAPRGRSRSKR